MSDRRSVPPAAFGAAKAAAHARRPNDRAAALLPPCLFAVALASVEVLEYEPLATARGSAHA